VDIYVPLKPKFSSAAMHNKLPINDACSVCFSRKGAITFAQLHKYV